MRIFLDVYADRKTVERGARQVHTLVIDVADSLTDDGQTLGQASLLSESLKRSPNVPVAAYAGWGHQPASLRTWEFLASLTGSDLNLLCARNEDLLRFNPKEYFADPTEESLRSPTNVR